MQENIKFNPVIYREFAPMSYCVGGGSGGNGNPPDLKKLKKSFLINKLVEDHVNESILSKNMIIEMCKAQKTKVSLIEIDLELVEKIKSFFNGKHVEISTFHLQLKGSFKLAQVQLIGDMKKSIDNDMVFLSGFGDSKSTLCCLPKELGPYILKLKYPFLLTFEEFKKSLPPPFSFLQILEFPLPLPALDLKDCIVEQVLEEEKKEDPWPCTIL